MPRDLTRIPGSVATITRFIELLETDSDQETRNLTGKMLMIAEEFGLPKAEFLGHLTRDETQQTIAVCRRWLAQLEALSRSA